MAEKPTLLIVDDEKNHARRTNARRWRSVYDVYVAEDAKAAMTLFGR
ncbi:MAG: hypothetical protein WDN00_15390 [Limisphaerales bacterium]